MISTGLTPKQDQIPFLSTKGAQKPQSFHIIIWWQRPSVATNNVNGGIEGRTYSAPSP